MNKQLSYISAVLTIFTLFLGCSNQVALQKSNLQPEQVVTAKLTSGEQVTGTIADVTDQSVTIYTQKNVNRKLELSQISELSGPAPVYDASGKIISEKEIARVKTNKRFWTYTLSGGLVSAGASFFLSSMIARSSSDDIDAPVTIAGTAAGTLVGGYLFSRWGKQKDREEAIDNIRLSRGSENLSGIEAEREKQEQLEKQLQRIKEERQQQEDEIKKLKEKINEE